MYLQIIYMAEPSRNILIGAFRFILLYVQKMLKILFAILNLKTDETSWTYNSLTILTQKQQTNTIRTH